MENKVLSSEIILEVVNNQVVVSSRQVAERFDKEHRSVLRNIQEILGSAQDCATPMFIETTYIHDQNKQKYPEYLMNRDGFTLLAMGFTGKDALQWKLKYVAKFNEMEQQLHKPLSPLEVLAAQAQALVEQERRLEGVEKGLDGMRYIIKLDTTSWRKDCQALMSRMSLATAGDYSQIQALREESYKLLNARMGVDVRTRLTNKRNRMAGEGICKSKRDKLNVLDVIADDKKLIEGYVAIVKEMAIKYKAEVA